MSLKKILTAFVDDDQKETRFEIGQQLRTNANGNDNFGMQWKLLCKDCTKLAALYTPVSYTHLDVYKRQP